MALAPSTWHLTKKNLHRSRDEKGNNDGWPYTSPTKSGDVTSMEIYMASLYPESENARLSNPCLLKKREKIKTISAQSRNESSVATAPFTRKRKRKLQQKTSDLLVSQVRSMAHKDEIILKELTEDDVTAVLDGSPLYIEMVLNQEKHMKHDGQDDEQKINIIDKTTSSLDDSQSVALIEQKTDCLETNQEPKEITLYHVNESPSVITHDTESKSMKEKSLGLEAYKSIQESFIEQEMKDSTYGLTLDNNAIYEMDIHIDTSRKPSKTNEDPIVTTNLESVMELSITDHVVNRKKWYNHILDLMKQNEHQKTNLWDSITTHTDALISILKEDTLSLDIEM
jgi:hypothetical protein